MTRRLAITILLTVWSAIALAGVGAWLSARAVLLADLDRSIEQRAMMLPQLARRLGGPKAVFPDDRAVVIAGQDQTIARVAGTQTEPQAPRVLERSFDFVQLPAGRFRRLTLRLSDPKGGPPLTVVYSASADRFDRVRRGLAIALLGCGAAAGAIAALAALALARMALRPLKQTAELVGTIDEAKLDRRINAAAMPAELRPVAERLNEMIARLQRAFEQRKRFLADASHELRTPVAAMITAMEVSLRRPRDASELTETLQTALAEARHLRQLVQALLRQARSDLRGPRLDIETLDATEMLKDCVELARPLADQRQVRLVALTNGTVLVRADATLLRSVLLNLMSNAIEYNRTGGAVEIRARAMAGGAEIVVKDDGPGIAAEHLPHLFEPFYRASGARDTDGHLGLGLFLVKSHLKAMGGDCRVESEQGAGTSFYVRLVSDEGEAGQVLPRP